MSLKIGAELRARLAHLAKEQKRTPHALACEALEAYVERTEARAKLDAQTRAAWEHYQETGLHVTGEEMLAWIESWGAKNEVPPPTCHT